MIFFVFLPWMLVQIYACHHCECINEFCEQKYEDYREILLTEHIKDRLYIEGKADAYREMTYFLDPYIYDKSLR